MVWNLACIPADVSGGSFSDFKEGAGSVLTLGNSQDVLEPVALSFLKVETPE